MWILASAAAFSGMAVCIKFAGRSISVWELVVLRTAFALLVIAPNCYRAGRRFLVTHRHGAHFFRSLLGMGGLVSFFFAVTHLDLALATTLGFTRALFVILLALLFLGEKVRWRRSLATAVGFLGVVICVQPGADSFNPWTLVALAFALFGAGVTTMVKRLTATESPLTIVFYTYVQMGLMAAVPAYFTWTTPSLDVLGIVALMGLCSVLGQSCMVHALRAGDATAVTPFEYSRLLFAAVFGYFLFAEVPANATWLGGAIIISSTVYIAIREARRGKVSPE